MSSKGSISSIGNQLITSIYLKDEEKIFYTNFHALLSKVVDIMLSTKFDIPLGK